MSQFNQSDFNAIDYAFAGDEAFDANFYLANNPDVKDAGVNPFAHYIQSGASEGRDPNATFDSDFYLADNPDVKDAGVNPFEHYQRIGFSEDNRFPNQVYQAFGTSDGVLVASAGLSDEQFREFQNLSDSVALEIGNQDELNPIIWIIGAGVVLFTAASKETIQAGRDFRSFVEESEIGVFKAPFPGSSDNTAADNNTGGGIPNEVQIGTEPFDLGDITRIDPETFPNGNDFLKDILDGKFEFPAEEESGSYFLPIEGVSTFREVEIADAQGKTLGEFDVIDLNRNVFIEKKSATGLNRVNPNTGLPVQTPQQFVDKQIVGKTRTRITRLNEEATTTVVTTNGTQTIPELAEIIDIKEFIFELEGDSPELREAVENGLNNLREEFPDYKFSAKFGA